MTVPRTLVIAIILPPFFGQTSVGETIPAEPVEIGTAPQFIFDQYVIDNHWAIKYKTETMRRVFHQPEKYEHNPIIADEGGCVCVLKDENDGQWRMWYQTWVASPVEGESGRHAIAYAESEDGISWTLPKLGLHEWKESKDNNIGKAKTTTLSGPV